MRPLLARRAFDAAVIFVAAVLQVEIWTVPVPGPKALVVPGMLLATLPLLLRRRYPFAAPACVFGALAALSFADTQATTSSPTTLAPLFFAFWSAGAHGDRRQALANLATGIAAIVVVIERDPDVAWADTSGHFLIGIGVWLVARVLRVRGDRASELERRAARLEQERDERERAAVATERRRIARDLHDVIGHAVSVMIVQAGAARMQLAEAPARAAAPLAAVEDAGRQALAEMRRLLGVLRARDEHADVAPQPGLGELDALLDQARAAGLPVELAIEGEPEAIPRGVDLAAYRIVQEALTNTRKHAGGANARVTVRHREQALELEIADDGRGGPGAVTGGHGLVGMRERVALYGGDLSAGPLAGGGYLVSAVLPLDERPGLEQDQPDVADRPQARAEVAGPRLFDVAVVLLASASLVEDWTIAAPFGTLPLLARRRLPFAAPAAVFAVQAAMSLPEEPIGGVVTGLIALLMAFWVMGSHPIRSQAVAGLAVGFATLVVIGERDPRAADIGVEALQGGNAGLLAVAAWLAAFALEQRAQRAAALEASAAMLERARAEDARAAVAEERIRIARELHDVIAHCVSVMIVQAGAARMLLDDDPQRALKPLLAVEDTGRQALAEMRRLLSILRRELAEAAPQPGLADLRGLVERCGSAGLPVDLTVDGEPEAALAPGVDLAAYRVVQEALTNAIKHAGPARASVTVRYCDDVLELEIADDGRAAPKNGDHGHGLAGMRERVALYGGDLEAGPVAAGGFAVHARFPLGRP